MDRICGGCETDYFKIIADFYSDNAKTIDFLRKHGVLPTAVQCPRCNSQCTLRSEKPLWRCTNSVLIPKSKKRRYCNFSVSDYKGTFLERCRFEPWKLMLFVNHWLSKHWDHDTINKCLHLSTATSVDWRSYCSEVTQYWFSRQEAIGGQGIVVEIDETLIVKRKYDRGRILSQIWLFGGIERVGKKRFVVPLVGQKRDKHLFTL